MDQPSLTDRRRATARRRLLALPAALAALALLPAPARAAGEGTPEEMRRIPLQPFMLPGKDRFSYVRLEVVLFLRLTEEIQRDAELVNLMRPRIVGTITETLTNEHFTEIHLKSREVAALKERIREIANAALGAPLVEEVLILSLLVT
ncbi:MAG TPA: flagellar basal body-associated FliL family protein [Azospirillaceae bacterium]|nr:flagellar basal body-associated FliL family protein [Azospirillaceae bacterium]